MKNNDVYLEGVRKLLDSGNKNSKFEAMELFLYCFNKTKKDFLLNKHFEANEKKIKEYFSLIEQRAQYRPLQYILGNWDFMGINLFVSEGVLIPRDDTSVLVNEVDLLIKKHRSKSILELGAGSGAISIVLALLHKEINIVAIEISEQAFKVMRKNINRYHIKNITPIRMDIRDKKNLLDLGKFDAIVSNPPYIATKDLKNLQPEVQFEPEVALNGGKDGLDFYYLIAELSKELLNGKGFVAVEIGIGQSENVNRIFSRYKFQSVYSKRDINNIERIICSIK